MADAWSVGRCRSAGKPCLKGLDLIDDRVCYSVIVGVVRVCKMMVTDGVDCSRILADCLGCEDLVMMVVKAVDGFRILAALSGGINTRWWDCDCVILIPFHCSSQQPNTWAKLPQQEMKLQVYHRQYQIQI